MNEFIFVYVTSPNKDEAKNIARHLLEKKLIACANIYGPVNSLYHWKGKVADEEEFVLIGKTAAEKFDAVKAEVEKIHPYDIPCIVKIPVSSNKKFFDWVKAEIT